MDKKGIWLTLGMVVLIVGAISAFALFATKEKVVEPGKYDALAMCMTEKGTKMYGAYWCVHCANQKKAFGTSFDKVKYIECSLPGGQGQTQECQAAGIEGYPTWEFGDGTRMSGEVAVETLAEKSGCAIN